MIPLVFVSHQCLSIVFQILPRDLEVLYHKYSKMKSKINQMIDLNSIVLYVLTCTNISSTSWISIPHSCFVIRLKFTSAYQEENYCSLRIVISVYCKKRAIINHTYSATSFAVCLLIFDELSICRNASIGDE